MRGIGWLRAPSSLIVGLAFARSSAAYGAGDHPAATDWAELQALVRTHGVDAARLKAYGDGPYASVASNDSEAGRVKNRRVELVKQ